MKPAWDIFCSIVDNFGDIGVCWRLARQLTTELGQPVRLWVDDLASFQRLCPEVDTDREAQQIAGVDVRHWQTPFPPVKPANIVIEGFGVRLPENYLAAMAACKRNPVWINLEHISAEPWVDGCHALPSPHPTLPLTKFFFFPGFTAATGGVLIERDLQRARDAFQADAGEQARFRRELGLPPPDVNALRVSLFSYDNAALERLLAAWSHGGQPIHCAVAPGAATAGVSSFVGQSLKAGDQFSRGQLKITAFEFLDFDRYDRLLWASDINFVRGEDSFVRAQLAARPLVWQAYVQSDNAHLEKQSAFMDRYVEGLDAVTATALRALHDDWNGQSVRMAVSWAAFMQNRVTAAAHARGWANRLGRHGNLANKLAEFCLNRLK
jgi:uncharacterized repeat protein (TIGR03837 family)